MNLSLISDDDARGVTKPTTLTLATPAGYGRGV
jgi:hypothetical protein